MSANESVKTHPRKSSEYYVCFGGFFMVHFGSSLPRARKSSFFDICKVSCMCCHACRTCRSYAFAYACPSEVHVHHPGQPPRLGAEVPAVRVALAAGPADPR